MARKKKPDEVGASVAYDHVQVVPRGWQCPVCDRVNAPHVEFCGGLHVTVTWTTTTTTAPPDTGNTW